MRLWTMMAAAAAAAALASPAAAQSGAPHEAEARAILEKLISFRSAEGHGQVPPMAAWIAETLKGGGVPAGDIATLPLDETVGMLVRVPGRDAKARPILFSAHMDVVDARPEDWTRDPFRLIEEEGYFFGRGVADNKTGVTSLVSTILRLKREGKKPRRTLVFAFVGDEETTFGTTRLIAAHDWVKNAEYAINTDAGGGALSPDGKPLIYLVQGAEKTYATFDVVATNPGGHSSRPRSDNAIYDLARAVVRIGEHRFPVAANALTRDYLGALGKVTSGVGGAMLRRFAANPEDKEAADALFNDPSVVGTTRTTCVARCWTQATPRTRFPRRRPRRSIAASSPALPWRTCGGSSPR